MATVTLQVVVGANTYTTSKTLPDAHMARLATAIRRNYGAELTDAEVVERWALLLWAESIQMVRRDEEVAAAAARTPITFT